MDDVTAVLADLHDTYVEKVNEAVAEGREHVIPALEAEFTELSLQAILAAGRPAA
jgi:hypothetical protein